MQLEHVLTAKGIVLPNDITQAVERQQKQGGSLGDNLIALGLVTPEQLSRAMQATPTSPKSVADTEISFSSLLRHVIKTMHVGGLETPTEMSREVMLPHVVLNELLQEANERRLVEVLGTNSASALTEYRYALTAQGRAFAEEAQGQNQYFGPAPVSLASYREQILKQTIGDERVDRETIAESFADLVIPDNFVRRLGPGINSGKCLLLYGPAGNGKTSVAEKVGKIFKDIVFIPYCVEVDGQIIKVFDPTIHEAIDAPKAGEARTRGLRKESFDHRWVPCKRPVIIAGGELTLEMLDLKFNALAKFYEAPLHLKAIGGTFIIDDFGRQQVKPEDILNRWIVPLQSRVDYLKLHTGKSFSVPFDELVIFSTNMAPNDLMDPAFLRRIPYKLKTENPSLSDYRLIFENVAKSRGLELTDEIFDLVIDELQSEGHTLACYQPGFIIEQIVSTCKYEGLPPQFAKEYVVDALANLYAKETDEDVQMSKLSRINKSDSGISDAA